MSGDVDLEALVEAHARTDQRLETLTQRVDALTEQMSRLTTQVSRLTTQVPSLTTQVSTLAGHVSWLRGDALERRYREKGHASFSDLARRLRLMSPDELDDLLDQAIDEGTLTDEDAHHVRLLDAVYRASREGSRCYLAIEVSVGVGLDDVRRVHERADLLARTGIPTLAVVAGEWVNPEAADAARAMGVWQVTNGTGTAPAA